MANGFTRFRFFFGSLPGQPLLTGSVQKVQFDETNGRLTAIEEKILSVSKWAEVIRKHTHISDICRADVEELIDHIEIGESDYSSDRRRQEIKIFWHFVGHIPT